MDDTEFAALIEQARQRVQDIALLIANEPEDSAIEVLGVFCRGLLEEGLTVETIQPLVSAVWARRSEFAGKASSIRRH